MDSGTLIVILPLFTLLAVIAFALINKKRTQERRKDDIAPKSTLAKDAPDHR